jgi:cobalt/nickel transport system permease protein
MHVPDGFLNAPTSFTTGAVAATGVALALRKSRDELQDRAAPLAGLTAAYVFAAQMINFPVGAGTSGHLMGGALAAVLVGPWTAALCLSVVLLVQALLFADGGLTALGTNITLIGLVTVVVGWLVVRGLLIVLPKRPSSVVPAAALGALVSVPVAAVIFAVLFAVGGQASVPFGTLLASMVGWHVLIGIGEAVITGFTVAAVIAVRPDLVYAARDLTPQLTLKNSDGSLVAAPNGDATAPSPDAETGPGRRRSRPVLIGGLLAAAALAGVVSAFASSSPDGLEFVAADQGFLATAADHVFSGFALADYGEVGGIPVGVAGLAGVAATIAAAIVVFRFVGRRSQAARDA